RQERLSAALANLIDDRTHGLDSYPDVDFRAGQHPAQFLGGKGGTAKIDSAHHGCHPTGPRGSVVSAVHVLAPWRESRSCYSYGFGESYRGVVSALSLVGSAQRHREQERGVGFAFHLERAIGNDEVTPFTAEPPGTPARSQSRPVMTK